MLNLIAVSPKDAVAIRDLGHVPTLNELEAWRVHHAARRALVWRWEWRGVLLLARVGLVLARWHMRHHKMI
jgi:hypothetical protein